MDLLQLSCKSLFSIYYLKWRHLYPRSVHLVRSQILICCWHYMHTNLDRLLGDTLHHTLALVIVLNGRVLQKIRGQIRSRLVLSPFFSLQSTPGKSVTKYKNSHHSAFNLQNEVCNLGFCQPPFLIKKTLKLNK